MNNKKIIKIIKKYEKKTTICLSIKVFGAQNGYFGYNDDKFVYAASLPKVFIATEVFRQSNSNLISKNKKIKIFPINVVGDLRSLKENNIVIDYSLYYSIKELVCQMLSISSNTAANQLIDIVKRENINRNIIEKYNWKGSEIFRKYLSREKDDSKYKSYPAMLINASTMTDFFFKLENNDLISKQVCSDLKKCFSNHDKNYDYTLRIDDFDSYYNKYGSVRTTLFSYGILSAIKGLMKLQRIKPQIWMHDSGVVKIGKTKYVISLLTHSKTFKKKYFPIKEFSKEIFNSLAVNE